MITPLDDYTRWIPRLNESAPVFLNGEELARFNSLSEQERQSRLRELLERPIDRFTAVKTLYFRARWAEVLRTLGAGENCTLLEIASGSEDMIPQAMDRIIPGSRYISANENKILTQGLRNKTRGLSLDIRIIEEDAARITHHLPQNSVDITAFQHGVNDVLQAILCGKAGIDTITSDWMKTLPEMIALLNREIASGTFEERVKPDFTGLLREALKVMKPGGTVVMNHYQFQLDLDWGYPEDLYDNMIPMVRSWMDELPEAREIRYEPFDPRWWLFLRKK